MIIRKGKLEDLKELMEILIDTIKSKGETYSKQWVRACLIGNKDLVLVAEENGDISGLLIAELWPEKNYSYLENLYVRPEFRRKRVAYKLMKEYENICKKGRMDMISCLTLTDNLAMQKFLKKFNYEFGPAFYLCRKNLKI